MSNGQERERVAPDVDVLARLAKAFRGGVDSSGGSASGPPGSRGAGNGDRKSPPERPAVPPSSPSPSSVPPVPPSPPASSGTPASRAASPPPPPPAPPPPAASDAPVSSVKPAPPAPPAPRRPPAGGTRPGSPRSPAAPGSTGRTAGAPAAPAPPRRTGLAPITPLADPDGRRPDAARPAHAARRAPTPLTPPRLLVAGAAAVVAALVGVAAVLAVRGSGGSAATVLARADLQPLVDAEPVEARLVDTVDGLMLELDLEEADLPAAPGYREVWLTTLGVPGIAGLVSLGPARPDGTYVVPGGIDYHDFPVVDVSVESADGNPAHSGITVLTGTLE